MSGAPPEARARLDALPPGLESALVRALAAAPADRFATAAELSEALRGGELPVRAVDRWSIAILPFVDRSEDAANVFLGDGLAEEITNALGRVRSLRVAARTSAFAFRDSRLDVRRIGEALGVGAVLEGSVRRSGEALRMTVQLIDVASGYNLWAERYDRTMKELLAIQDEIARGVAQALRGALSETDRHALVRAAPPDAAAYEYYLRGRQFFHQARKRSLEFALGLFRRAIEIDPGFALAHAGLADCCSLLHMYYPSSGELACADETSRRALELAPDLAETHAARGFALFQLGRGDEAAAEFQTAMHLGPALVERRLQLGVAWADVRVQTRGSASSRGSWRRRRAGSRRPHASTTTSKRASSPPRRTRPMAGATRRSPPTAAHSARRSAGSSSIPTIRGPPPCAPSPCAASVTPKPAWSGRGARSSWTPATPASATTSPASMRSKAGARMPSSASTAACAWGSATASGSCAIPTWRASGASRASRR